MTFPLTRFAIPNVLFFFGSCSVQDHVIPAQSCKVREATYLTSYVSPGRALETVETLVIDGKTIPLVFSQHATFEYDAQGRIVRNAGQSVPLDQKRDYLYQYTYFPDQLEIYSLTEGPYGEKFTDKYSIPMNKTPFGYAGLESMTFDAEGYYIKSNYDYRKGNEIFYDGLLENTIENGNIVKTTMTEPQNGTTRMTAIHEFDLTKLNIPQINTFQPKESKNLPTKSTYAGPVGGPYSTVEEYRYTFDANGQVKRRIRISNFYTPSGTLYQPTTYDVTNYTITCQ